MLSLELMTKLATPKEEFDAWFQNYCPAEAELSPAFAAGVCIRCEHKTNLSNYKDRCEILNARTKLMTE